MTSADTYQRIATLLSEVDEDLGRKTADELRGKHLGEDLGLDSLDIIKFILLVEEAFGCKLADEDIDRFELLKLDKLAAYLAEHGTV